MHRRAQAAESFAIRYANQFSNEAAWKMVAMLRRFAKAQRARARLWQDRYRDLEAMPWYRRIFR